MTNKETLQPTSPEDYIASLDQVLPEGKSEVPQVVVRQVDEYVAGHKREHGTYPRFFTDPPEPTKPVPEGKRFVYKGPPVISTRSIPSGLTEKLGDEFTASAEAFGLSQYHSDSKVESEWYQTSNLLTAVAGNDIKSFLAGFKGVDEHLETNERSLYFVASGVQQFLEQGYDDLTAIIFVPYQIFSEKSYAIEDDPFHDLSL